MRHGMIKLALPLAVSMLCGVASAASITLLPNSTAVNIGDTITVQINMDFTDVYSINNGTVGGGVDIVFDNTKLASVSYQAGTSGDSGFRRDPVLTDGNKLVGIAAGGLGEVDSDLSDGDQSSPALGATDTIGTLTFTATAVGDAAFSVSENVTPAGGFWSFQNAAITPTFNGSTVGITEAVAACPGDFNNDGFVEAADLRIFRGVYRTQCSEGITGCLGDLNDDGFVEAADLRIFRGVYRQPCP